MKLAEAFGSQVVAREYALQWEELAPQAQAMWPAAEARTAMLDNKFAHALVLSVTLGTPELESMWTAPEEPAMQVPNVWNIPVEVDFADPSALRPLGVTDLFAMTPLQIGVQPATAAAQILGEGPESMDAPIIPRPRRLRRGSRAITRRTITTRTGAVPSVGHSGFTPR